MRVLGGANNFAKTLMVVDYCRWYLRANNRQTMELLNALIADSNTDFDLAVYPNRQHSISEDGARPHLYRVIDEHFAAHLG